MKIYNEIAEMPEINDPHIFNWGCKNCQIGPCYVQHERKPRICPRYGRRLADGPSISIWEVITEI